MEININHLDYML